MKQQRMRRIFYLCLAALAGILCSRSDGAEPSEGPFQVVRSFPVSEPTWGAKTGDLYLIAAERSLLVFKKTGQTTRDYALLNTIYPGHNCEIVNAQIDGGLVYFGAKAEGLLAYRVADLASPNAKPALAYKPTGKFVGAIAIDGDKVYAAYLGGGLGVFDKKTLKLLGEAPPKMSIGAFAVGCGGVLYGYKDLHSLAIVDARDPKNIRLAGTLEGKPYMTEFRGVSTVVGPTLYTPQFNGGVCVYDLANPLKPVFKSRYQEKGPLPKSKDRSARDATGGIRQLATDGRTVFVSYQHLVDSAKVTPKGLKKLANVCDANAAPEDRFAPAGLVLFGKTLAMPTTMEGMRFFDVSDPAAPKLDLIVDLPSRMEGIAKVGRMLYVTADTDGVWQLDWEAKGLPSMSKRIPLKGLSEDLVLRGHYIYVANGIGLATIDVSKKSNPRLVDYWDFPYKGKQDVGNGWVEGVDVADRILYVAVGPKGMATFDLKDPAHPKFLTMYKPPAPADWKGPHPPLIFAHDVTVDRKRKMVAFGGTDIMALIDVSNPAEPKTISSFAIKRGCSDGKFSPDGKYLFTCESDLFEIFDISNPATPKFVKEYHSGPSESVLFYKGYVLAAGRGAGVEVYKTQGSFSDLVHVQNIPSYFYNSKFFVEGKRIFTNCQGVHELRLTGGKASR